ncbi:hypothetical protein Vretifemale_11648, partial [Volvox reticuliferus]
MDVPAVDILQRNARGTRAACTRDSSPASPQPHGAEPAPIALPILRMQPFNLPPSVKFWGALKEQNYNRFSIYSLLVSYTPPGHLHGQRLAVLQMVLQFRTRLGRQLVPPERRHHGLPARQRQVHH